MRHLSLRKRLHLITAGSLTNSCGWVGGCPSPEPAAKRSRRDSGRFDCQMHARWENRLTRRPQGKRALSVFCCKYWERKSPLKIQSWTRSKARPSHVTGKGLEGGGVVPNGSGGCGEALPTLAFSEWRNRRLYQPHGMEMTILGKVCQVANVRPPWE